MLKALNLIEIFWACDVIVTIHAIPWLLARPGFVLSRSMCWFRIKCGTIDKYIFPLNHFIILSSYLKRVVPKNVAWYSGYCLLSIIRKYLILHQFVQTWQISKNFYELLVTMVLLALALLPRYVFLYGFCRVASPPNHCLISSSRVSPWSNTSFCLSECLHYKSNWPPKIMCRDFSFWTKFFRW